MISQNGTGDLSTSLANSLHHRSHVGRIGSRPTGEFQSPTFAAGAVLWRHDAGGDIEIAVEHRPRYDDWTLPKGKVDPGENLAGTATREIREETGCEVQLGWLIGYVHYPVRKRTKVVYYWTAEAISGGFEGNPDVDDEVDDLRWLSAEEARNILSYELDIEVLNAGLDLLSLGSDRRVLLVRHGKSHAREGWGGDDNRRPLVKKGRRQSSMLVSQLSGYQPAALYSAHPDRCVHTISPLSEELNLPITVDAIFGDESAAVSGESVQKALSRPAQAVVDKAAQAPVTVIASQGTAIPELLREFTDRAGFSIDDLRVKKSSTWVLHFKGDELLGVDYFASPLAVK